MKRLTATAWAICLLVSIFSASAFSKEVSKDVSKSSRPNFLFVYADDQRYDQVGVVQQEQGEKGRYPWFKTPNMDRLANGGVRFRNAFATCSLCAPSRAAFLTGRYNHCNGIASNFRELPLDTVTHATLLRQAGYATAYVGKWHMNGQRKLPPCFDFQATIIGHGQYVDCPLVIQGVETPTTGWVDDVTTGFAIDFIGKQKETGKPWSVVVGFKAPHGPFTPPERAAKRFEGEKARSVPNLDIQAIYTAKQGIPFNKPKTDENGLLPCNLDHFRCVSACDDNLGKLLDALDRFGYAENTVVVYCSDNGFYFGEHGLADKRSAYEESLRIPFLVRFPKLGDAAKGKVVDEPILNIDLAPTLLDYAGVAIPKEMQGKSWRPLLEGKKPTDWRKAWFYEYFAEKQRNTNIGDITAIRSLDAKLIKYSMKDGIKEDWTELFDVAADPYELKNLYGDPAHEKLQREMETEFDKLRKEVDYKIPDYVDRPEWWDAGVPGIENKPIAVDKPESRLEFLFKKDAGTSVEDSSGKGNHGIGKGIMFEKATDGALRCRFDGKSWIDVKKSPSLNFAKMPWTTEVVFKADAPDGVLISVGGDSYGYSLRLDGGKLVFTTTIDAESYRIVMQKPVDGQCKATALFTADRKMVLYVGSRKVGERKLVSLVPMTPNIAWRIGAPADVKSDLSPFTGLIDSVKLSAGELPPK